jgi:hypothetical protein
VALGNPAEVGVNRPNLAALVLREQQAYGPVEAGIRVGGDELRSKRAERLSAYAVASREIFPAYGDAVDKLVSRIEENGAARSAPAPGQSMPPLSYQTRAAAWSI